MPPLQKGSIIVADGNGNVTSVNVSSANNKMALICDDSQPTGVKWANQDNPVYTWTSGSVPINSTNTQFKQWFGSATSTSGIATFNVTLDGTATGTAIYTNLSTCYILVTPRYDSTSNTLVPFASVRRILNNKQIEVNVKTGNSASILLGGTYTGLKNATDGIAVNVYILGM